MTTSPTPNAGFVTSSDGRHIVSVGSDGELVTRMHSKSGTEGRLKLVAAMDGLASDICREHRWRATPLLHGFIRVRYIFGEADGPRSGETVELYNDLDHDPSAFLMSPVTRELVDRVSMGHPRLCLSG